MVKDFASKLKEILKDTVNKLKGSEKRKMLARITQAYGTGGQSFVTKEFNVGRDTIRKGVRELNSGIECKDAFNMRGRKKITNKLPKLCEDIKSIAESQCQIDPKFTINIAPAYSLRINILDSDLLEGLGAKRTLLVIMSDLQTLASTWFN